jgi:transcriptional regulator with XRE-family HTH domain
LSDTNNYRAFGDCLSKAKAANGKTFKQLQQEMGSKCPFASWHNGDQLPSRERLEKLALVYVADLTVLIAAYDVAKAAHEGAARARKEAMRPKPRNVTPEVPYDLAVQSRLSRIGWGRLQSSIPARKL